MGVKKKRKPIAELHQKATPTAGGEAPKIGNMKTTTGRGVNSTGKLRTLVGDSTSGPVKAQRRRKHSLKRSTDKGAVASTSVDAPASAADQSGTSLPVGISPLQPKRRRRMKRSTGSA